MKLTARRVSDIVPAGAPPDLRGRRRPDRTMQVIGTILNGYLHAADRVRYDASVAGHNPDRALRLIVTGREIIAEDDNVAAITFQSPTGTQLPIWHPGCHLDLHLPSGRRRQYSLCGDPADRSSYRIAVRRIPDGAGGSIEMHGLRPGSEVTVRGPRNGFPFVAEGRALFVAGGIGITPIIAMVRAAKVLGMDWQFVYCGRSRETMPFLDEIESWESERVVIRTDDVHGYPREGELLARAPIGGAVYCCGPTSMLDSIRREFRQCRSTALHFERFGPPPILDGHPLEVQLVSSGAVLDVPADKSVLAAVREHRPNVAYSCQQGFCGACKVRVLSGEPDHRETRLTTQEQQDHMLICVSRAKSARLVLDL